MRFFRRHQAKFYIAFAIAGVAAIATPQVREKVVEVVKPDKDAPTEKRVPEKGVDADTGNSRPEQPGPPSGGREKPPERSPKPPSAPSPSPESPAKGLLEEPIQTVCGVTSALNRC